jgi:glucosyl-dolichyl phosphate glucuronosyltransferase
MQQNYTISEMSRAASSGRPVTISVILCTYNRAKSLTRALESAASIQLPPSTRCEVLVVDNDSNDRTREVIEAFCCTYPERFRYVSETRRGKSHALNTGIRESRGEILAFIDDDVIVEASWLEKLTSHLSDGEWAGAAGRILAQGDFAPPRWMSTEGPHSLGPLALFDRGPEAGALTEAPYGTNMAYRRAVFDDYGFFRTDLGPQLDRRLPQKSEDSEFGKRLLEAGVPLRYEPAAVVYHEVPEARLQKSYFLKWWFDKARADILAAGVPSDAKRLLRGVPANMILRLMRWILTWAVMVDPAQRFSAKLKVWWLTGGIVESHRQWRDKKRNERQKSLNDNRERSGV